MRRRTLPIHSVRRQTVRPGTARIALSATTTATTAAVVLLTPSTVGAARAPGADPSALVAATALGLGWLVVARLVVATLAALASAVPGVVGTTARRVAGVVSPRFARSAVRIACGVAVAGAPLAGAGAALADPPDPTTARTTGTSAVRIVQPPVPVLDRQVVMTATPSATPDPAPRRVVVVRSGDSLWGIAARELGPRATDAQVAAAWPRWYDANADVIGPDPGLLRPGQHLRVPDRPSRPTRAAS